MYNLIINPTYNCNMQCVFCYRKKERETYQKYQLPLEAIDDTFNNLDIGEVTISGGEPTLLPFEYLFTMLTKIREHFSGRINFETNFTNSEVCAKLKDKFNINIVVGYDFHIRPLGQDIWNKLYECHHKFDIKICASPFIIKTHHPNLIIRKLSVLKNLENVEITRYVKNENNQWNIADNIFENFVKRFIETDFKTNFNFLNYSKVKDNTFLYKDLYLQPNGNLEYLEANTIIEFKPFANEVPNLPDSFCTYSNNLIKYMKEH